MDKCFRCERGRREVKLLDAIYKNDIVKVCERCAVVEEIPIIRKPSTSQLKEAERGQSVSERLRRLSGVQEKREEPKSILEQIRKLDENPELEKPEEKSHFNLVDNFNWHVQRARRNKGLSQKQLGWALGESEAAVKMVEKGELPEDSKKLIRKLEQFLQIKLRERTEEELEEERRKLENKRKLKFTEVKERFEETPIESIVSEEVSEEDTERQDVLFEREISLREEDEFAEESVAEEGKKSPVKVLSFKPEVMKGITISDLQRIREEKEKEERLERIEEERKRKLQREMSIGESVDKEKKKQELKEIVAEEMKDVALGKKKDKETIEEKRRMLNKAVSKASKAEEKRKKDEKVPTIYELMERKRDKTSQFKHEGKEEQKIGKVEVKKENKEVPTISDLIERKKQKEESIFGDDIEIIE